MDLPSWTQAFLPGRKCSQEKGRATRPFRFAAAVLMEPCVWFFRSLVSTVGVGCDGVVAEQVTLTYRMLTIAIEPAMTSKNNV